MLWLLLEWLLGFPVVLLMGCSLVFLLGCSLVFLWMALWLGSFCLVA